MQRASWVPTEADNGRRHDSGEATVLRLYNPYHFPCWLGGYDFSAARFFNAESSTLFLCFGMRKLSRLARREEHNLSDGGGGLICYQCNFQQRIAVPPNFRVKIDSTLQLESLQKFPLCAFPPISASLTPTIPTPTQSNPSRHHRGNTDTTSCKDAYSFLPHLNIREPYHARKATRDDYPRKR